jgi:hypothetical protein
VSVAVKLTLHCDRCEVFLYRSKKHPITQAELRRLARRHGWVRTRMPRHLFSNENEPELLDLCSRCAGNFDG